MTNKHLISYYFKITILTPNYVKIKLLKLLRSYLKFVYELCQYEYNPQMVSIGLEQKVKYEFK